MKTPFALIHSDIWGPAPVTGGQGLRYFLLFVDDYSRMTWVYFLKSKSEVFENFTQFYALIQTQYKQNIQILRSDNGGEYINSKMQKFFTDKGLVHQTTCAYTPEQNGVAERKNRYLLEITRALLIESKVPKSFWPEALATSVYLINRLPTNILNFKTPLDIFSNHCPVPSSLSLDPKVFGCSVFVHVPKHERTKFSPCAVKCVFLGYGKNQKGYRCYNPNTRQMHTTMNCDFVEGEYFYNQPSSQGESQLDNMKDDSLGWTTTNPTPPTPPQPTLPNPTPPTPPQPTLPNTTPPTPPQPTLPNTTPPTPPQSTLPNPDHASEVGPAEEVSGTAGQSTESSIQNMELSDIAPSSDPSSNPEVSDFVLNNTDNNREEEVGVDGDTGQYELPQRSTRGIPPKRYSPDWKGRKSKYSITNIAQGQLTKMARAFEAALYEEEEIPQSFEEAMKHKH